MKTATCQHEELWSPGKWIHLRNIPTPSTWNIVEGEAESLYEPEKQRLRCERLYLLVTSESKLPKSHQCD